MEQYWGGEKLEKKNKEEKKSGDGEKSNVETLNNHIYFYSGVDFESAITTNKALQELSTKLLRIAFENGFGRPVIHLHINSGGGYVVAGTAITDTILRLKKDVDIYTYVEGRAASAATIMSVVGTKRFITKNSLMLIHQLSGALWGKYNEMLDDAKNHETLMDMIKNVYKEHTNVPEEELMEILSHDLYWDANKCLELGLVDEII